MIRFLGIVIYWSIVLLPFSIAIAPAPTNIFWGVLIFFYLVRKIILKERIISFTPINHAFILFLIISVISMINSINYISSIRGIFKLFQYGLLFIIMANEIKERRQIEKIVLFMCLGALLSSVDAFWQLGFGRDFIRGNAPIVNIGLARATAAFPNANVLGVYLTPIFALTAGVALYYFTGIKKIGMLFVSAVILLAVLLTYSRPAILACFTGLLFLAIIKKDKILITLLLIAVTAFPFVLPKSVKEWAKSVHYNPIIFMCNHDRVSVYRNALNMIKHHPALGVGVNTFSINYLKYKLPEPANAQTGDTMYAHNNFLQIAGETGLLGLGAFFWLLFKIFQSAFSAYNKNRDRFINILALSLIASIIVFLINGLTETSLYYKRVAVIFWYIVGLVLALKNFSRYRKV